jgi:type IX secretion system PorP/SprF family membrane protein
MKKFIIISVWLIAGTALHAQDINFSQFYELPLLRNPALAGIYKGDIRATSAFRYQWGSVTTPYKTTALGTEMKFSVNESSNNFLSLGVQITSDVAGDSKLSKRQLLPMFTYHKSMSAEKNSYLSLGVMGGAVQQSFDIAALKFGDQFVGGAYSPTNPTRQQFSGSSLMYWDAAVGLSFSSEIGEEAPYYLGVSYFHFTQPKVAFNDINDIRLNKKMVINAGIAIPSGEYDRIIAYGDYFIQGGNNQIQGGLMYKHHLIYEDAENPVSLSVGGFYRWNDAFIPVVKLDYYKVGVGLTYDVNVSKLTKASHVRGGFELTLSYRNFLNIKNSSANSTRCPVSF